MTLLVLIIVGLMVYLLFDYLRMMRRDQIMERLDFGFDKESAEETSLWEGASNLLQLEAIRQLLLRSAITRSIDLTIRRAGFRISLFQALGILAGLTVLASVSVHFYFRYAMATVASLLVVPLAVVLLWRVLAERQQKKMDLQLPSLINSMLTTMRAGGTPIQALQATARNAENPMRDSMDSVLKQLQIGQSPITVWKEWSDFWNTKSCRLLSTGIRVKWEAGGQMSSVLEHILESIEFRKKIEQRINTLTTQAKLGSWVLSAIPAILVFLQYRVRPEMVTEMFTDDLGQKIYIAAGVLTLVGFFWLRKLASIKME